MASALSFVARDGSHAPGEFALIDEAQAGGLEGAAESLLVPRAHRALALLISEDRPAIHAGSNGRFIQRPAQRRPCHPALKRLQNVLGDDISP